MSMTGGKKRGGREQIEVDLYASWTQGRSDGITVCVRCKEGKTVQG